MSFIKDLIMVFGVMLIIGLIGGCVGGV